MKISSIQATRLNITPVGRKHIDVEAKLQVIHDGTIRHNQVLQGGGIQWKASAIDKTTAILINCTTKCRQFTMPDDFIPLGFAVCETTTIVAQK